MTMNYKDVSSPEFSRKILGGSICRMDRPIFFVSKSQAMILNIFIFVMAFFAPVAHSLAQTAGKEPLEISAAGSLEWHRNDHKYVALGGVVAKQGATTITADKMIADYREGAAKKAGTPSIYRLTAQGHVVITSGVDHQAFGDHAVYNLDEKRAVMTGQELKMQAPGQIVTARDRFEYSTIEGRLNAIGNALAVKGDDSIAADQISAWFSPDATTGQRTMDRAEATGNVTIATPTERATGTHGTYTRDNDIAVLNGPVQITRGPNILNGTRAEVNLKTNVSTVFGDAKTGGRVKGTFFPESKKK